MKKERELEKIGLKRKGEAVVPEEISPWIEKQEKEQHLSDQQKNSPVVTDDKGQTILAPAGSPAVRPTTSAPLTKMQMAAALKQKTSNTIRWLAEWYKRILKIKTANEHHGAN